MMKNMENTAAFKSYNDTIPSPLHEAGLQMQGFKMTFANGYTVSVAFGSSSYSNQGMTTAEVGAWDADDNWVALSEQGDVLGWQTPDEVVATMALVASF